MAIMTEQLENGLVRTWSDVGMKIERDGVLYDEAIDPADEGRKYNETNEPVASEEATEADKDAALRRFGVEVLR